MNLLKNTWQKLFAVVTVVVFPELGIIILSPAPSELLAAICCNLPLPKELELKAIRQLHELSKEHIIFSELQLIRIDPAEHCHGHLWVSIWQGIRKTKRHWMTHLCFFSRPLKSEVSKLQYTQLKH